MEIEVNGQPREVPAGTTVADLLAILETGNATVAVERNEAIVPRAKHGATELAAGDRLEVVQFVGGG